jgi:hypothetical protein
MVHQKKTTKHIRGYLGLDSIYIIEVLSKIISWQNRI